MWSPINQNGVCQVYIYSALFLIYCLQFVFAKLAYWSYFSLRKQIIPESLVACIKKCVFCL